MMIRSASRAEHQSKSTELLVAVHRAVTAGTATGVLALTIRDWSLQWGVPDLSETASFQVNQRLKTTIARWVVSTRCLELGPQFFRSGADQKAILCHEFAHAAVVLKFGRQVRAHGPEWREFVLAAGFEPRSHHTATRRAGEARIAVARPRELYEHRCLVCHAVRFARKPVKSWRCIECAGAGLPGNLSVRRSTAARSTP